MKVAGPRTVKWEKVLVCRSLEELVFKSIVDRFKDNRTVFLFSLPNVLLGEFLCSKSDVTQTLHDVFLQYSQCSEVTVCMLPCKEVRRVNNRASYLLCLNDSLVDKNRDTPQRSMSSLSQKSNSPLWIIYSSLL